MKKPQPTYTVTTEINGPRIIQLVELEHLDLRKMVIRKVLDTSEKQVRVALINMGWTPPHET